MTCAIKWLQQPTSILPLVVFRLAFGLLLCLGQIRYIVKGWVGDLLVFPSFHFTYSGFEWVQPFSLYWTTWLVAATALFAFFISIGFLYRISTILFFLGFTYLELIDKAWYLNHYYFVSIIAFLLIFIPAHRSFSVDCLLFRWKNKYIDRLYIFVLRFQLALVYFFAGIAKLKSDWLIEAQPMHIWLQARTDLPMLGWLFTLEWTAYAFSWLGLLYDLSMPFLLWHKKTRPWAYIIVIIFHSLTFALFQIGMFPWIMISATLIFFTAEEWNTIGLHLETTPSKITAPKWLIIFFSLFMAMQIVIPLRHYFYRGAVLENQKGLRFAWHVMVMEKTGHVTYTIKDISNDRQWTVFPSETLTLAQEKQMSIHDDMIIAFGQHLLAQEIQKGCHCVIEAEVWTALNGRPSEKRILHIDYCRLSH